MCPSRHDHDCLPAYSSAFKRTELQLESRERARTDVCRVLQAEMWEAGKPQGGFHSFLEAWDAGVPQGLRHVIAHVTALPSAEQGCVKELLLGMRGLYDSCIGRRGGAEGSGDEDAAKSRARDQAGEKSAGKGESSEAVCSVDRMGGKGDQGKGKEKMEKPQLPATRGAKAASGRGRGRGGAAKKVVDTNGGAKFGIGRGRGANKQALHPASQGTRILLQSRLKIRAMFDNYVTDLFVSPPWYLSVSLCVCVCVYAQIWRIRICPRAKRSSTNRSWTASLRSSAFLYLPFTQLLKDQRHGMEETQTICPEGGGGGR